MMSQISRGKLIMVKRWGSSREHDRAYAGYKKDDKSRGLISTHSSSSPPSMRSRPET
jgi:hypothetical protein